MNGAMNGVFPVVLATINARYAHASLGLRYLFANAGDLQSRIVLVELVCGNPIGAMADRILAHGPSIVAFGVYIWNVVETTALIRALRDRTPALTVIVGGPEVSHEADDQAICRLADHVVQGPGDISFARLVRGLLDGPRPLMKTIAGEQPDLERLTLPYRHLTDRDLLERIVYVEASRGCPFKCSFCLSALDRTAWAFPLDAFLAEIDGLVMRGARRFKFVDRTFNLKPAASVAILDFFLRHLETQPDDPCFVHFELVPDHLPDALKAAIARFPPGTLQFEIGIQTFDPAVQRLIDRRQDNGRAEANLRWLKSESNAHLHVDLIAGLPGETLAGFAAGFDRLVAIGPDEIQVGILKRLRGAPITRLEAAHALCFDREPPYEILSTGTLDAGALDAIRRMARFHDRIVNSGRMPSLAADVLDGAPFARMMALSEALERRYSSRRMGLEPLIEGVVDWLSVRSDRPLETLRQMAIDDYRASGAQGRLAFMERGISATPGAPRATPPRQSRHLATRR